MGKTIDLTGQIFGKLHVISRSGKDNWGGIMWRCECECGSFIEVNSSRLRSGNTESCGCKRRIVSASTCKNKKIDISGKIFGKLKVVSENGRDKNNQILWDCVCNCGNNHTASGGELRRGNVKSCGCSKYPNKKWKSKKEMYDSPVSGKSVFFKRIPIHDNPEIVDSYIAVSCKLCKKKFHPSLSQIISRVASFEGKMAGESNFYCCDSCKEKCPIYRVQTNHPDPRIRKPRSETKNARACQTKTLKQLQCDHSNGQSYCEKCGDFIDVELHHTLPVAQFAKESVNPASHMLLCAGCHVELHRSCVS